jgi:hypothetical protein
VSPEIRQTYVWCHHWSRERLFMSGAKANECV